MPGPGRGAFATARVKASCEECAGLGGQEDSGSPTAPARTRLSHPAGRGPTLSFSPVSQRGHSSRPGCPAVPVHKRLVEVRGPGRGQRSSGEACSLLPELLISSHWRPLLQRSISGELG